MTNFDEYTYHMEAHRFHIDTINKLRERIKELEELKSPLEQAISIGFYRTVAALRKKECDHRGRFVNTDYSDYLLENMKEILK